MKRRDFERHLRDCGCTLHHHRGNHDIWVHPQTLLQAAVPRHAELGRHLLVAICRQLGIAVPTAK
ncbi:MAG: type II toxin-antitoxin system HicA family toxin [Deltaproteobacteria bacterium]|nr:type II toxin-antitoxin system HicA family toxin [Deltaproteobacteria bacterium]